MKLFSQSYNTAIMMINRRLRAARQKPFQQGVVSEELMGLCQRN